MVIAATGLVRLDHQGPNFGHEAGTDAPVSKEEQQPRKTLNMQGICIQNAIPIPSPTMMSPASTLAHPAHARSELSLQLAQLHAPTGYGAIAAECSRFSIARRSCLC